MTKTMTNKLEGKTAVITGGTEGNGLATAKLFVKEGAYAFITGRRRKELDEAGKAIGPNATDVQGRRSSYCRRQQLGHCHRRYWRRCTQKALGTLAIGGSLTTLGYKPDRSNRFVARTFP